MYAEPVCFPEGLPLGFSACKVGSYHLHCHAGVIEILMVLRGSARVKAGFENFDMIAGDYLVIRELDAHSFTAMDAKCEILVLHLFMEGFAKQIPYLKYVYFACESFDLAEYKNEAHRLRQMIIAIVNLLARQDDVAAQAALSEAQSLLWILASDYDLKNYYNRKWDAGFSKTEKYYKIMGYIVENYAMKNLQEYIAQQENYSKSYIAHFFKEIGNSSFKDILEYVRVSSSEFFLLSSDLSITEISERCGFSDVKYYIANFRKWFLHTPAEYRKLYLPEVCRCNQIQPLSDYDLTSSLKSLPACGEDPCHPKSIVNPLAIKAFGVSDYTLRKTVKLNLATTIPCTPADGLTPFAFIPVDFSPEGGINEDLGRLVTYFLDAGYQPTLLYRIHDVTVPQARQCFISCKVGLGEPLISKVSWMLLYGDLGHRSLAAKLEKIAEEILGPEKVAVAFMP